METFRCAVLSSGGFAGSADEIACIISHEPGVSAFRAEMSRLDGVDVSVFVLVSSADALGQAIQQVTELRHRSPASPVLVAMAEASTVALEALLAAGVFDFFSLPVDAAQLIARVRRAVGLTRPSATLSATRTNEPAVRGLVYTSEALSRVAARLTTMAHCSANVLILGETGTGKEVCAQAVHYLSERAPNPWVAVNCGAIPAELVEAELFGHVKGAYTTALAARTGLIREAEQGSLFLDDVDCLPLSAQAKLLRFLQEREYRPVGSNHLQHADVRIIAASNNDLQDLAQRGAFRTDLYFRLNVLRLNLPSLRERRDDIPVLALHFMRQFAREFRSPVSGLSPAALRVLCAHEWPGNVRELRHVIERAVLMASGPVLGAADIEIDGLLQAEVEDESFRSAKLRAVNSFERAYLERMLAGHNGNVTRAADASKKDRRAFFELMRKYDIQPQRFRSAVPR